MADDVLLLLHVFAQCGAGFSYGLYENICYILLEIVKFGWPTYKYIHYSTTNMLVL